MKKVSNSYLKQHIENHFDDRNYDVSCHKRKQGYTICWADTEEPLARVRPTGKDDDVEVFNWDGDRWRQVGESGLVLPLDKALEYITDDPDDLFFLNDELKEIAQDIPGFTVNPMLLLTIRMIHPYILLCAVLGGAAGGMFSDPVSAFIWATSMGTVFSFAIAIVKSGLQGSIIGIILFSIPNAIVSGVGGTIGGTISEILGGGLWGGLLGLVVGGLCTFLMFSGRFLAWIIAFSAGLTLADRLVDFLELRDQFVGLAIVALIASVAGKLYSTMAGIYLAAIQPAVVSSRDKISTDNDK